MGVRAALVGCGKRGRLHANGMSGIENVDLVAFADPQVDLAKEMAGAFDGVKAYGDTQEMLSEAKPDLVAICTRPAYRLEIVQHCIDGGVRGIQCEKPMAMSWNHARRMHNRCERAGIQLAFTHQRRFRGDFTQARMLIGDGAIGEVNEIQGYCSNFFDWGTHWFDMFFFLLGDIQAKWVLAQADFTDAMKVFDAPVESKGISRICFENDVIGLMVTSPRSGAETFVRVLGEKGMIEIFPHGPKGLRILRDGGSGSWENPPVDLPGTTQDHPLAVGLSLAHSAECLETGKKPLHGSEMALKATEVIYASLASAKGNCRIDLPMEANPELTLEKIFERATFAM